MHLYAQTATHLLRKGVGVAVSAVIYSVLSDWVRMYNLLEGSLIVCRLLIKSQLKCVIKRVKIKGSFETSSGQHSGI